MTGLRLGYIRSQSRFWRVSETAVPNPRLPRGVARALSINLTVSTMFTRLAIVALAWAFVYIREALMTLFLALFFALVLEPVVRLMQRHLPLGRGACATALVLGLVVLGVVVVLLLLIAHSPGASGTSSRRCPA